MHGRAALPYKDGQTISRPQAQRRVLPGAYRRRARFKSGSGLHFKSERRVGMTYIVNYRQFKRGRRSSNYKVPIQADSLHDTRIKFLKAINLAQKLQNHPFNCNHVHIVSIFEEVASDG
jgi:hypothetical protein